VSSLLEIAPSTETVSLRGKLVDVPGIGAPGIAALMLRFPVIHDLFMGKGSRWM